MAALFSSEFKDHGTLCGFSITDCDMSLCGHSDTECLGIIKVHGDTMDGLPRRYISVCNNNPHYYDGTNIQTKTGTYQHDMTQFFLDTPNKCNDMQAVQAVGNHMQKKCADAFKGIGCFKGTVHIDIREKTKPY